MDALLLAKIDEPGSVGRALTDRFAACGGVPAKGSILPHLLGCLQGPSNRRSSRVAEQLRLTRIACDILVGGLLIPITGGLIWKRGASRGAAVYGRGDDCGLTTMTVPEIDAKVQYDGVYANAPTCERYDGCAQMRLRSSAAEDWRRHQRPEFPAGGRGVSSPSEQH